MSSQFLSTPKNPGMLPDLSPLEDLVDQDVSPRQVCGVLAKMFQVQQTEVAILRLNRGLLNFIYPDELRTVGSIPISSSSIAAHTGRKCQGVGSDPDFAQRLRSKFRRRGLQPGRPARTGISGGNSGRVYRNAGKLRNERWVLKRKGNSAGLAVRAVDSPRNCFPSRAYR